MGGVLRGRSCVPCCVWRVCGCVRAVMFTPYAVDAAGRRPAGVGDLWVCLLRVGVRCVVRALFACAVLGDTRHDAAAALWCARGARWACENVKHRGCVIHAMYDAHPGRALPALSRAQWVGCCAAVLRLRLCVVACASLHRASLWLLCDCAALRGIVLAVDCSCGCVSLRCGHARDRAAALQGGVLRVCCRWWRRRSLAVHVAH